MKNFIVKFELFFNNKTFNLKHSTFLSIFQKKLCYSYDRLGAIPREFIADETCDGKFAGSMICSLLKLFWYKSGQLANSAASIQKQFSRLLFIYFTFIVCKYSPLQYAMFSLDGSFSKDIYNYTPAICKTNSLWQCLIIESWWERASS